MNPTSSIHQILQSCYDMLKAFSLSNPRVFLGCVVFLAIIGFILLVLLVRWLILHGRILLRRISLRKPMTPEEFSARWIVSRAEKKGLKYNDGPGVYVIRFSKLRLIDTSPILHEVYVGQSTTVAHRVEHHLSGLGNGEVYHSIKANRKCHIRIIPCSEKRMNALEKHLIKKYNALEAGYNRTAGGSAKR